MSVNRRIAESLERLTFENREADFHHHSYDEDIRQYEYIKRGDLRALEEGKRMFEGPTTGSLSDDPVMNYKYLFVASITLVCRFCIEGGMPAEVAFNLSDLYIRQVDQCHTVDEIFALHDTMYRDYTTRMQGILRRDVFSRPVHRCMDYIDQHLQQPITVKRLAQELGLSETYVSIVFKRETGVAVSEYIRRKRVDTAKTLLQYTEFSCVEIAEYLCFSSDSHFSRVFREHTGQTPTEYRRQNYRKHWGSGESASKAKEI
ncbi:MAG: helix-turn-helix domain-containing protein [Clostridia bacterium]|nr:helix-turn-helix domain-containing protein [Clostridia bacterium]